MLSERVAQHPSQFAPYLKHISPDGLPGGGENLYNPSKVSLNPSSGAVTASLTSLSVVEWAMRGLNYLVEPAEGVLFGNRFPAPTCPSGWEQRPGTATYDSPAGAHADLTSALLNLPGNSPPLGGFLIKHCVQNGIGHSGFLGGQDLQTLLRNTSGTVQVLNRYSGDVSVAAQASSNPLPELDLISWLVTSVNTGGNTYLAPGSAGTADVPAGTSGAVKMQPDRLRSLLKIGGDKTLGEIFDKFSANQMYSDPSIRNKLIQTFSCVYNSYNALTGGNGFANTSRDFASALHGCFDYEGIYQLIENWMRIQIAAGNLSGDASLRILKGLENMRELFKWIEFGQIAVDVSDSLIWGALPDAPTLIEHYAAKPSHDEAGRILRDACVSPYLQAWRIDTNCQNASSIQQRQPTGGGGTTGLPAGKIIRNSDGNAWFVASSDLKMHSITDGGTYICLARHYAVDWGVDGSDLRSYLDDSGAEGDPATCDESLPPTRKITQVDNPDLFAVLRLGDGPESWIIMGAYRYPIPSGPEFNCWVNPQYRANIEVDVYDFVSQVELGTWPVGNGSISNCGDPENPSF